MARQQVNRHFDGGPICPPRLAQDWKRSFTLEPAGPQATMDKQNAEIGRQLVSLLVDRIEGRIVDGPVCRTVKPQLILAESQLV